MCAVSWRELEHYQHFSVKITYKMKENYVKSGTVLVYIVNDLLPLSWKRHKT